MQIEIDQSIKIEETGRATAVGLSDDIEYAVLLDGKSKRRLQEAFRRRGTPRLFVYRTFVASVVLLVRHAALDHLPTVVIDQEYPGQERVLHSIFLEMWTRGSTEVPVVEFKRLGRTSKAHRVSYLTATGKRPPDRVLSFDEVRRFALR